MEFCSILALNIIMLNDPRWNAEQFQFSTSPKPVYKRLNDRDISKNGMSSPRGSRLGSIMGSRLGSNGRINREESFINVRGLPR